MKYASMMEQKNLINDAEEETGGWKKKAHIALLLLSMG